MSQRLTQQAKDHGSSDNITIVVVFLRPVQELKELYETKYSKQQGDPDSEEEELLYKVGPPKKRSSIKYLFVDTVRLLNRSVDVLTKSICLSPHFRA